MNSSTINYGTIIIQVDPAQLLALARLAAGKTDASAEDKRKAGEEVNNLSARLAIPPAAVTSMLSAAGQQDVPRNRINETLIQSVNQFSDMRRQLQPASADVPRAAELKQQARAALDAGQFDQAQQLLSQAKEFEQVAANQANQMRQMARQAEDAHNTNAARLLADQGNVALMRVQYRRAADAFRQAAQLVPASDPRQRADYLGKAGDALRQQGERDGDVQMLRYAIDTYRQAQQAQPAAQAPRQWALWQGKIGEALRLMGQNEVGEAARTRLGEAADALQAARDALPREQEPDMWATTEMEIGSVLYALGQRENGTSHLEQAAAADRAAMEIRTREHDPLGWARLEGNLGNALFVWGSRESGPERLEQAVAAYRAALEVLTRARDPWNRALFQSNMCDALVELGARQPAGTQSFEDAIAACHAALEVQTREKAPLYWANTMQNLGRALDGLGARQIATGAREAGMASLRQAVATYQAALEVQTREAMPKYWAETTGYLGRALRRLAALNGDAAQARQAVDDLNAAVAKLGNGGETDFMVELAAARTLAERLGGAEAGR
jgi:tetratricopeptide (TPR) repeat protein